MYKWFFAWRYLHTKLIAAFAMLSVMLCVALVLVVLSVMGGFLDTLKQRARGLLSDIVLDAGTLQGWPFYGEFAEYLHEHMADDIAQITPAIYNYSVMRVPASGYTRYARVVGIRLDEYCKVNSFAEGLHFDRYYPGTTTLGRQRMPVAGWGEDDQLRLPADLEQANQRWRATETDPERIAEYDKLPFAFEGASGPRVFRVWDQAPGYDAPELFGIIVGCDLLNDRQSDGSFTRYYARGSTIALTIMPMAPTGTLSGEPPIKLPLRYADDSRTGVYEIDSVCVYVDFQMLQQKLAMDAQERIDGSFTAPRTTQLLISLDEGVDMVAARDRINAHWSRFSASIADSADANEQWQLAEVTVKTWEDMQRPIIAAVEKEKVLVTFLFSLISIVAIMLIGCIFYMIVEKKTRDIGVLKSLGASSSGVASMFIIYAAAVGVVGSILGTGIGATFVWYINDIQDLLVSLHKDLRVWDPEVYSFDKIPNVVKMGDVVWIVGVAIVASMIGAVIPAVLAGKVWPVRALRYE